MELLGFLVFLALIKTVTPALFNALLVFVVHILRLNTDSQSPYKPRYDINRQTLSDQRLQQLITKYHAQ